MKTMHNLNVITTQFLAYGTERVKPIMRNQLLVLSDNKNMICFIVYIPQFAKVAKPIDENITKKLAISSVQNMIP